MGFPCRNQSPGGQLPRPWAARYAGRLRGDGARPQWKYMRARAFTPLVARVNPSSPSFNRTFERFFALIWITLIAPRLAPLAEAAILLTAPPVPWEGPPISDESISNSSERNLCRCKPPRA